MVTLNTLTAQIHELKAAVESKDSTDTSVSAVSVGWHIEHSFKVMHGIVKLLEQSDPSEYRPKFNLSRFIFGTTGWIPRGKAKAPKAVRPEKETDKEVLLQHADNLLSELNNFQYLPERAHFTHPYFGPLNRDAAARFMVLHTNHHLKIVRDILRR